MGEHVTPVVIVLDEIALRETQAISDTLAGYADSGNGEIAGLIELPFNAVLRKDGLVERIRTKRMRPVHLQGALPVIVGGGELRNHGGGWLRLHGAEETPVEAVILEVFIDANKILRTVGDVRRVESTAVDHRRRTRQVVCGGRPAGSRENLSRRRRYPANAHVR